MARLAWLVGIVFAAAVLTGCTGGKDASVPVIRSGSEYTDELGQIEKLTRAPLEKFDTGEPLTEIEKADLKTAEIKLKGLISFRPETFALYFLQGRIDQVQGEHDKAIDQYRMAVERMWNLKNPDVVATLGETYYRASQSAVMIGNLPMAAAQIDDALKNSPENPIYLTQHAGILLQMEDRKGAEAALDRALKIDPEYERAKDLKKLIAAAKTAPPEASDR